MFVRFVGLFPFWTKISGREGGQLRPPRRTRNLGFSTGEFFVRFGSIMFTMWSFGMLYCYEYGHFLRFDVMLPSCWRFWRLWFGFGVSDLVFDAFWGLHFNLHGSDENAFALKLFVFFKEWVLIINCASWSVAPWLIIFLWTFGGYLVVSVMPFCDFLFLYVLSLWKKLIFLKFVIDEIQIYSAFC